MHTAALSIEWFPETLKVCFRLLGFLSVKSSTVALKKLEQCNLDNVAASCYFQLLASAFFQLTASCDAPGEGAWLGCRKLRFIPSGGIDEVIWFSICWTIWLSLSYGISIGPQTRSHVGIWVWLHAIFCLPLLQSWIGPVRTCLWLLITFHYVTSSLKVLFYCFILCSFCSFHICTQVNFFIFLLCYGFWLHKLQSRFRALIAYPPTKISNLARD